MSSESAVQMTIVVTIIEVSAIHVTHPAVGVDAVVSSVPGGVLQFNFDINHLNFVRSGTDLVMSLDGGGKLTLQSFFAVGGHALPTFELADGTIISSDVFLTMTAPDMDLTIAADPLEDCTSSGADADDSPYTGYTRCCHQSNQCCK